MACLSLSLSFSSFSRSLSLSFSRSLSRFSRSLSCSLLPLACCSSFSRLRSGVVGMQIVGVVSLCLATECSCTVNTASILPRSSSTSSILFPNSSTVSSTCKLSPRHVLTWARRFLCSLPSFLNCLDRCIPSIFSWNRFNSITSLVRCCCCCESPAMPDPPSFLEDAVDSLNASRSSKGTSDPSSSSDMSSCGVV